MGKKNSNKPKSNEEIIRKALYSYDEDTITQTLNFLRENGNTKIIPDLINVYNGYRNTSIGKKIYNVLLDLKCSDAAGLIVNAIEDNQYSAIRKDLLSLTWMTSLDFSKYFNKFVDWFISFELSLAFEAFTAIEYMHFSMENDKLKKSITLLRESITEIDESKKELLVDLVNLLEKKMEDDAIAQKEE